jgi:DNA-directed RNA polymerase subunit F
VTKRLTDSACIVSLCPGDHEEAKTLIPSLQDKISDDELQGILEDLQRARLHGKF